MFCNGSHLETFHQHKNIHFVEDHQSIIPAKCLLNNSVVPEKSIFKTFFPSIQLYPAVVVIAFLICIINFVTILNFKSFIIIFLITELWQSCWILDPEILLRITKGSILQSLLPFGLVVSEKKKILCTMQEVNNNRSSMMTMAPISALDKVYLTEILTILAKYSIIVNSSFDLIDFLCFNTTFSNISATGDQF